MSGSVGDSRDFGVLLRLHREAAVTCESLGDRLSQAGALGELALVCRLMGDTADAATQAARLAPGLPAVHAA